MMGTVMTAKIQVEDIIEHEDGSATVVLICDDEARRMLIEEGVKSLLEKALSGDHPEYKVKERE